MTPPEPPLLCAFSFGNRRAAIDMAPRAGARKHTSGHAVRRAWFIPPCTTHHPPCTGREAASRGMKHSLCALLLLAFCVLGSASSWCEPGAVPAATGGSTADGRVLVEYFLEPGCPICGRISNEVLPAVQASFGGLYELQQRDTNLEANYLVLARYQETLKIQDKNATATIVVDGRYAFAGWKPISEAFPKRLEAVILGRLEGTDTGAARAGNTTAPNGATTAEQETPAPAQTVAGDVPRELLTQRLRAFTILGVGLAGLIDGINPCAISTLVFFMSMLAVFRVSGPSLLLVGVAFCTASFVTYTAIGFGLLRMLYLLSGFHLLRETVEVLMIAVLTCFAALSFRDAWRFKVSGDARDVMLQLPDSIKAKIHHVIRQGLGSRQLVLGSLVIGSVVTGLESVCTGQVYVPTLVFIIKGGSSVWLAAAYLLLYNLLFVTPLILTFILTYQGLRLQRLLQWSRANVIVSKVALGLFFVLMAIALSLL